MSLCDFSNNLKVHGYIVGILLTFGCISSLGRSYHITNATNSGLESKIEGFDHSSFNGGPTNVVTILVGLALVIIYWYGFLKRNRPCILISMVFVALGVIVSIIIFIFGILAVIGSGWPGLILMVLGLIFMAVEMYMWQVMAQLRKSFLNDQMPNAGTEKNLPV
ncbi:uncharacterized protein LOC131262780 [Anopheles coustani]|uniref:uncharacterized protein LOC131262780 n=1 Tax=Anopheles coustani TaxID=139045 RepID=UPI00265A98C3|nr:uncharacterized protein LOC131262780 [Anopheles coustani]